LASKNAVAAEKKVVGVGAVTQLPRLPKVLRQAAWNRVGGGSVLDPRGPVVASNARLSFLVSLRTLSVGEAIKHCPVDGLLQLVPAEPFPKEIERVCPGGQPLKGEVAAVAVDHACELEHDMYMETTLLRSLHCSAPVLHSPSSLVRLDVLHKALPLRQVLKAVVGQQDSCGIDPELLAGFLWICYLCPALPRRLCFTLASLVVVVVCLWSISFAAALLGTGACFVPAAPRICQLLHIGYASALVWVRLQSQASVCLDHICIRGVTAHFENYRVHSR
jgi:hypothetical protein